MARIELPGGHWAELRDAETVTTRQRRPIERAARRVRSDVLNAIGAANGRLEAARKAGDDEAIALAAQDQRRAAEMLNEAERDAMEEANDATAAALVERWSFEAPVTLDSVLDLPAKVGDALRLAVAPLSNGMFLVTEPDPKNPNPPAPGGGSPDSETPSPEAPSPTSLTRSEPTDS